MKLMALNEILSTVRSARSIVRDATISALYHGCIHGNVSWADGMTRNDVAAFDKSLRAFMPLKWEGSDSDGDKGQYIYSRDKAEKFCNDPKSDTPRGFTQETTWEDFSAAMLVEWEKLNTKAPKVEVTKTREEILKTFDNDLERLIKKLKKEGVTLQEIINRRTTVA